MPGPCTLVGYINPNDAGDPMPAIVRFRMRTSAAEPVTFRLATVTKQGDTLLAQAVGTGATVTTQGTGESEEFPARLAVNQREHIALDAPAAHVVYNQGGQRVHAAVRAAARGGPGTPRRLEPPDRRAARTGRDGAERDGDGFGDETQDSCPTERTTQGACDTTGPRVRRIAVRARRMPYRLSEDATVTFRVQRARRTRYVTLRGRFTDAAPRAPMSAHCHAASAVATCPPAPTA